MGTGHFIIPIDQSTPYHTMRKKRQCQLEELCLILKVASFLWERNALQEDVQYVIKIKINRLISVTLNLMMIFLFSGWNMVN